MFKKTSAIFDINDEVEIQVQIDGLSSGNGVNIIVESPTKDSGFLVYLNQQVTNVTLKW